METWQLIHCRLFLKFSHDNDMTYKFSCFVNTLKLALHAKKETSGVNDLLQSGGSIVRHYKHRGIASLSHLQVHIQFEPVKLIQDVDTHWNFEYQHDACKTVTYMDEEAMLVFYRPQHNRQINPISLENGESLLTSLNQFIKPLSKFDLKLNQKYQW